MIHIVGNPYLNFLLTLFFGAFTFLGFYFTIRKKYPKSLSFVETEKTNLNTSILIKNNKFKITYNEGKIDNDLYLFKGFLLNTGKFDLQQSELENNLYAELENGKWLDYSIISTSDKIQADFILKNNKLYFESDLIKINEYVFFEALAETTSDKILFSHRIANLGKIKNVNSEKIERNFLKRVIWNILLLFVFYFFSSSLINDYNSIYPFMVGQTQSFTVDLDIKLPMPEKDTVTSINVPYKVNHHIMGENDFNAIADFIHKEYNVFDLMVNNPDTIIELHTTPYGDFEVIFNQDVIDELKTSFFISLVLFFIWFAFTIKLVKNVRLLRIQKKILKTIGTKSL